MKWIYNGAIRSYGLLLFIAQFFSSKAKKWVQGRKNWKVKLTEGLKDQSKGHDVIWIHSASYGEFEQGKPVIDKISSEFPDHRILLTFFSPSGYESKKDYSNVHHVSYLPLDTKANANAFFDIVKPKIALFIRYEFWFNFMTVGAERRVPFFYFSSSFRKNQIFFKGYGSWFAERLRNCTEVFVRDGKSKALLDGIGVKNSAFGDTRFDSVEQNKNLNVQLPRIEDFKASVPLIVFGSTWKEDESLILAWLNGFKELSFKVIIAPHEINLASIVQFQERLKHSSSLFSEENLQGEVLIIDSIGLLKNIYRYANVSYVGGGFGAGIHNLLEPAVYGKPVVFGPKHQKFEEATELIMSGIGYSISSQQEFNETMNNLLNSKDWDESKASDYFQLHIGATGKIVNAVRKFIQ